MDDNHSTPRRIMTSRDQWMMAFCAVGTLVLACAGMLVGATAWTQAAIHTSTESSLAAINTQAAIFAKVQTENEKRITTLEIEQLETSRTNDRLALQVEQLRSTEGDLATAVQRLSDLLPERKVR
jgi:hypothetical protein